MKMKVAEYISSELVRRGAEHIFLLNGGMMMHLVDTLGRPGGLQYTTNHHEQASAIATDGYARRRGGFGVCFATSGPGATNLLTGLVGAWQDSTPVLFITGQSKSTQTIYGSGIDGLRQFGTFEVDIVPIVTPVTKYAVQLRDPRDIRFHLEKALYLAVTGRPGPTLIDIPLDLQGAQIEPSELRGFDPEPLTFAPSAADLAEVSRMIRRAERPLILAGYGIRVAQATREFRDLLDNLGVPVVTTHLAKDVLFYDHPLFVGHSGPKGDRAGNFAVQTADLIVSIGSSLHSQTTGWESELFAPDAIKVQVDLDDAVFAREQVGITLKVHAGAKEFINALNSMQWPIDNWAPWRARCASWKRRYPVNNEPHVRQSGSINFYDFAESLSNALPENSTVVSDAGTAFYVMGQALRIGPSQRFISSGSLGAMGFALPAANGVAVAEPNAPAICVTGDGSLMTNVHELATMSQFKLNVKLFVMNNDGYVSMRNTQREYSENHIVGADRASGVFIPAMSSLAQTFELPYFFCDDTAQIDQVIAEVLAVDGPVLCEIIAPREQKVIPAVTSVKLADGRMQSSQIHAMSPLLPDDVMAQELEFIAEHSA